MLKTSDSIKAISGALFAFQGGVEGVGKNSTNPGFKSRYANLQAVRDTAVPVLQAVGVVFLQTPGAIVDGNMEMTTRLIHVESGEWIEGTGDIPLGKRDPQGAGSAQTYSQRYHLMAMLGLPPIDDDGEGAMERRAPASSPAFTTEQPKQKSRDVFEAMMTKLRAAGNLGKPALAKYWQSDEFQEAYPTLPDDWRDEIIAEKDAFIASYEKKPGGRVATDPTDTLNQQFKETV